MAICTSTSSVSGRNKFSLGFKFLGLLLLVLLVSGKSWGQTLTQSGFTGVIVPQYMGSGTSTRLPVMFRATVSGLTPSTNYRYFTQGATNSTSGGGTVDFGTSNSGAGNPLIVDLSGPTYITPSSPTLVTPGTTCQTFTTDASGNYTGWFGFVNTANARFTAGNTIYPTISLNAGGTATTIVKRLALDLGITVLAFNTAAGATNGSFLNGTSSGTAKNLVALYDNVSGSGRPLAVTVIEAIGVTNTTSGLTTYGTSAGNWGVIIPNSVTNGVRRIEQYSVSTGNAVNDNQDADGNWTTGSINTTASTNGTTAKSISSTDAPLNVATTVVLSSPNPAVSSATLSANSTNNPIYRFDLAATNANATLSSLSVTTSGNYASADVSNMKLWYQSSSTFNSGTATLLSTIATPGTQGTKTFSSFTRQIVTSGNTGYFFITVDIASSISSLGSTLGVNAVTTSNIGLTSSTTFTGSTNAGGTQTIGSSTYSVTYNANAASSGSVPTDGSAYSSATQVTVLGNTGSLAKTNYTFSGWNTAADGSGTTYQPTNTFNINANTTLYALWTGSVTYSVNGGTGTAPTDATSYLSGASVTTASGSGLSKAGYTFGGWNTAAAGTGTTYAANTNAAFSFSGNITLYAKWTANNNTITFNGNGSDGGSMSAQTIATDASANLSSNGFTRTGYSFNGWNTASDGSGTAYANGASYLMGVSNVTLYAQWTVISTPTINVTGSLSAVSTTYGTASSATSFSVSGSALTADILVTPPSGFEVSQTSGGASGYAATQTVSQSGGTVNSTTIYVRLAATTTAASYSGNAVLSSSGATPQNVATVSSTVSPYSLSVSGLSGVNKPYDGGLTASLTGSAVLSSTVNSDVISLDGSPSGTFVTSTVANGKTINITGLSISGTNSSSYSLTPPTTTANITTVGLTISGISAVSRAYNTTNVATLTGTAAYVGLVNSESFTVTGTPSATFADASVATAKAITITGYTAPSANYTVTQPTALTADISKASQTITGVSATATKYVGDVDYTFAATSTTSATNALVYVSSNTAVATINASSGLVHIVAGGNTTITVSQAGNANYNAAPDVIQTLTVKATPIAAWDFNAVVSGTTYTTYTATTFNGNLVSTSGANNITRGTNAAWSTAGNSFRTAGFKNEGIATSNTDYFQVTIQAATGKNVSLSTIDANLAGTGSYCVTPGVTSQFAYSLDGTNFTLIGSAQTIIGTPQSLATIDLTSISSLQNVSNGTTIYLRYYASGQTATGGWGFYSAALGTNGLAIGGSISIPISTSTNASTIVDCATCNVSVASSSTLNIDANKTFNSVTIAPGAKLTLADTYTLTAPVTLQSSASGTATFVDANTTVSPSAITATVQQYLPTGRNWYVGVPITDASATSASALTGAGASSVSYWDETTGAWVNSYSGALSRGKGYIAVSASGSSTNNISFTGTLNTGGIPVTVTRTAGVTKEGFNLIANPYPSYLNAMTAINASAKMEPTIWYRTKGSSYEFETVNTASGIGTNVSNTGYVTGYVPPMQAFWVRVLPNTDPLQNNSETLTFTNAMRYHANPTIGQTTITTTVMKAPSTTTSVSGILRLQVSNGINSDETLIYTNDNAANGYDAYDSQKMTNGNTAIPEIYSLVGNNELVINGMNSYTLDSEIPLGFRPGKVADFSLKATELLNIGSDVRVMLKDSKLKSEVNITDGSSYTFSTTDTLATTNRFSIIFRTAGVATDINKTNNQSMVVYKNANNQIMVNYNGTLNNENTIAVYNALGQKVVNKQITDSSTAISIPNGMGVYMVTVNAGGKIATSKIVLK